MAGRLNWLGWLAGCLLAAWLWLGLWLCYLAEALRRVGGARAAVRVRPLLGHHLRDRARRVLEQVVVAVHLAGLDLGDLGSMLATCPLDMNLYVRVCNNLACTNQVNQLMLLDESNR